jgi:hypothetical protein
MKVTDVVELINLARWGGRTPTGKLGILIKQTYCAYENKNNRWDVLMSGIVVDLQENVLRRVTDESR